MHVSSVVTAAQKGISLPALQRLSGHDRLTTTSGLVLMDTW
jgi:hypothetical protein